LGGKEEEGGGGAEEEEEEEEEEEDEAALKRPASESSSAEIDVPLTRRERLAKIAPFKSSLSERMEMLEQRYYDRKEAKRILEEKELQKQGFYLLPKTQIATLTKAFSTFDTDDSGSLEPQELRACLREMGLGGATPGEKRDIAQICLESLCMSDGVDLYEFSMNFVGRVRSKLQELRSDEMLRHFYRFDIDGSGFLSDAECAEVARSFGIDHFVIKQAKLELKEETGVKEEEEKKAGGGLEVNQDGNPLPDTTAVGTEETVGATAAGGAETADGADAKPPEPPPPPPVKAAPEPPPATRRGSLMGLSFSAGIGKSAAITLKEPEVKEEEDAVDFDDFQVLMGKGRERRDRIICNREREVQRLMGINEAMFKEFRMDLLALFEIFNRYDMDESGALSTDEIMVMLKEFGLTPKSGQERYEVEKMLLAVDKDENGEVEFRGFLALVRTIRGYRVSRKSEEQKDLFDKYDKDRSGSLSIPEVSALLADLGQVPCSRKEQEELANLIACVDSDGSGTIGFSEMQILCQRVDEKLQNLRYEAELQQALKLGFGETQLRDMRWAFDELDSNASESLDIFEIREALKILGKPVSMDVCQEAFATLDCDGNYTLCFYEFLEFMRIMRDQEGLFGDQLTVLESKVCLLDLRLLRNTLEAFKLSKIYLCSLDKEDLVELFNDYFSLAADANLHEALGVKSIAELLSKAVEREQELSAKVQKG